MRHSRNFQHTVQINLAGFQQSINRVKEDTGDYEAVDTAPVRESQISCQGNLVKAHLSTLVRKMVEGRRGFRGSDLAVHIMWKGLSQTFHNTGSTKDKNSEAAGYSGTCL